MFDLIRANKRRSILLVAGFVLVVVLVGAAIGLVVGNGPIFTLVAIVISAVVAFSPVGETLALSSSSSNG